MSSWYCDSSYDPISRRGVIAYMKKGSDIVTEEVICDGNTQLEFVAVDRVLDLVSPNDRVHTDCQRIVQIAEGDHPRYEYQRDIADKIRMKRVTMVKVEGHKKSSLKNDDDRLFSIVDKESRRILRKRWNS